MESGNGYFSFSAGETFRVRGEVDKDEAGTKRPDNRCCLRLVSACHLG